MIRANISIARARGKKTRIRESAPCFCVLPGVLHGNAPLVTFQSNLSLPARRGETITIRRLRECEPFTRTRSLNVWNLIPPEPLVFNLCVWLWKLLSDSDENRESRTRVMTKVYQNDEKSDCGRLLWNIKINENKFCLTESAETEVYHSNLVINKLRTWCSLERQSEWEKYLFHKYENWHHIY